MMLINLILAAVFIITYGFSFWILSEDQPLISSFFFALAVASSVVFLLFSIIEIILGQQHFAVGLPALVVLLTILFGYWRIANG